MTASASRYDRLGPLGRTILPLYTGRSMPRVAVIAGYFDDSIEGRYHALGGYGGELHVWDDLFAPGWRRIVDGAPHTIKEFKASDCRQGTGEFSAKNGWTLDERKKLVVRLVDYACSDAIRGHFFGFGSVVAFRAASAPSARGTRYREEEAFTFCLVSVVLGMFHAGERLGAACNEVQLVVDEKATFYKLMLGQFESAAAELRKVYGVKVRPPVWGESDKLAALQFADLLAYETRKEAKNRVDKRKPSRALERLVEAQFHAATCIDYADAVRGWEQHQRGLEVDVRPKVLFQTDHAWRAPGQWGV